jgi:hypothetical protein
MNIFARPEIVTEVDQQKVNDILARLVLPPEIVKVDAEFGPDNSGDPSVKLRFHLRPDLIVDKKEIARLSKYLYDVQTMMLRADIGGFPYTRLEQAS